MNCNSSNSNVRLLKLFRDQIRPSVEVAAEDPNNADFLVSPNGAESADIFLGTEEYHYEHTAVRGVRGEKNGNVVTETHLFTSKDAVRVGWLFKKKKPKVEIKLTHKLSSASWAKEKPLRAALQSKLSYLNRAKDIKADQSFTYEAPGTSAPELAPGSGPLAPLIDMAYRDTSKIPDSLVCANDTVSLLTELVFTSTNVEKSLDDLPL